MPDFAKTEILILLDRSGSMESIRTDTIGGFNTFLSEQQALPGACRLTLIQFDSHAYHIQHRRAPIATVDPLTEKTFRPRGSTPLLDSMARAIDELGEDLRRVPESERPGKVIFVTITDGQENCSRKFERWQVMERVKHQAERYGWQFVYLGANQDAIAVAAELGIAQGSTMSYAASAAGTSGTYAAMGNFMTRARGASGQAAFVSNSFSDAERAQAAGEIFTTTSTTTTTNPEGSAK